MKFENRVAVITGAAGRIGCALAEDLGREGVRLALTDINSEALQKQTAEYTKKGFQVKAYQLDVTDSEDIAKKSTEILHDFGKVDILVNNAGIWPHAKFAEMEESFWIRVLDLNLNSVFRMTKAFLPGMRSAHYGRIINLGSIAGEAGLPGFSAYSTAKAAVIMLTKNLAMEFAKEGITANCVSPGMVADEKKPCPGTWVERTSTGDEISRVITFLASDDSGFITGVDYTVDGGRILGPHNCNFSN